MNKLETKEAIEILKIERDHMTPTLLAERIKAIDMAISALQAQDGIDTNVGDMECFYDGHKDKKQDTKGDVNEK